MVITGYSSHPAKPTIISVTMIYKCYLNKILKLQHSLSVIVVFNNLVVLAPHFIAMYKPKISVTLLDSVHAKQSAPKYMGSNLN